MITRNETDAVKWIYFKPEVSKATNVSISCTYRSRNKHMIGQHSAPAERRRLGIFYDDYIYEVSSNRSQKDG